MGMARQARRIARAAWRGAYQARQTGSDDHALAPHSAEDATEEDLSEFAAKLGLGSKWPFQ